MVEINKIYHGDCLKLMPLIPDKSIDMILCDLPYGTTACKWDEIIPFFALWNEYDHMLKDGGAIVLTASQPFTSQIVHSNIKNFKYEWIWEKNRGSNFATTKYQPMKEHESILIFGNNTGLIKYYPIMEERAAGGKSRSKYKINASNTGKRDTLSGMKGVDSGIISEKRNPRSIQKFNTEVGLHPTQKPVPLFEYLIQTYTKEGETVLDNCAGSGTTAIACINTKRNYICMEKNETYFNIMSKRINDHKMQQTLF